MKYLELNELKTRLGIEGTDYDTVLSSLIDKITAQIDAYLGKNLGVYEIVEIVDSNGKNKLYLKNKINEVLEVKNRNSKQVYEVDFVDGYIIYLKQNLEKVKKNILVKYTTGYSEVPLDIKEIAFNLIFGEIINSTDIKSKILESIKQKNIKSQKIGNLSITYFGDNEKNNLKGSLDFSNAGNINKILNKYKSFTGLYT